MTVLGLAAGSAWPGPSVAGTVATSPAATQHPFGIKPLDNPDFPRPTKSAKTNRIGYAESQMR